MTNINLLNWREKRTQIQNNRFFVVVGVAVFVCFLMSLFIDYITDGFVASKKINITYLSSEITQVEDKINKIKDLQDQKELLLTRRQVIESLQESRPFTVKIFDNLPRVIPTGIVITEITRKGDSLQLIGIAESNAAVSIFMKNVVRLKWVKDAKLSELKTVPAQAETKSGGKDTSKVNNDAGKVTFQLKIALDTGEKPIILPAAMGSSTGKSTAPTGIGAPTGTEGPAGKNAPPGQGSTRGAPGAPMTKPSGTK
jgi:type IV pilus assembly protein PilN